jgi:receptor protein-tyrosine kinase
MSLVERAAKRLEELAARNSGDLAGPPRQDHPSLLERALRRLETPPRREPALGDAFGDALALPNALASDTELNEGKRIELDLPKLAADGYLAPEHSESEIANEFRRIKRPLIQACQGKLAAPVANANRIMITSAVPGEGKSFVALNLALSIAMERDSRVLLIDADTTRQSLSQLIGIDSHYGLLDLLADPQAKVSDALLRTNIERLTLLPTGARRQHATELLASEAMEHLMEQLATRYADRILIFDTAPLLSAPEPAVLANLMGQIVLVVEADRTTHKVLTSALAAVQSCPMVTTVLNKSSSAEAGYYYHYTAQE